MILNTILEQGSVKVNDLAARFEVTTMTIRRDLAFYEKQNLITTNYGGAVLNRGTALEPSFTLKSSQQTENKKKMGEAAVPLIKTGESVFFDCGTTIVSIVRKLPGVQFTAVSNSLAACSILKAYPNIKLICTGGTYDETSDGFTGVKVHEALESMNIDKAFISTQGFDIEGGATVPDENDAALKRAIIRSARTRILVVGHEKFGVNYFSRFAECSDFDYIVSDRTPDGPQAERLRDLGIQLIVAGSHCTLLRSGAGRLIDVPERIIDYPERIIDYPERITEVSDQK